MIYYLLDQPRQLLKIGCSRDPVRRTRELRLRECRDVLLLATEPGSFGREREQHERFSALRVEDRGREWFSYSGALREYVEGRDVEQCASTTVALLPVSAGLTVAGHHVFGWVDQDEARLIYCGAIPVRMTVVRDGPVNQWCWNCHTIIVVPSA